MVVASPGQSNFHPTCCLSTNSLYFELHDVRSKWPQSRTGHRGRRQARRSGRGDHPRADGGPMPSRRPPTDTVGAAPGDGAQPAHHGTAPELGTGETDPGRRPRRRMADVAQPHAARGRERGPDRGRVPDRPAERIDQPLPAGKRSAGPSRRCAARSPAQASGGTGASGGAARGHRTGRHGIPGRAAGSGIRHGRRRTGRVRARRGWRTQQRPHPAGHPHAHQRKSLRGAERGAARPALGPGRRSPLRHLRRGRGGRWDVPTRRAPRSLGVQLRLGPEPGTAGRLFSGQTR